MYKPLFFTLNAILLTFFTQVSASEQFVIQNTQTLQITSEFNKQSYELYVRLPKGYKKSTRNYPLVLINDTSYSIATASGILHLMEGRDIEEVILVGISYSKGTNPLFSRTRDYTPTFAPKETQGHSKAAQQVSGQANNYVKFIDNQVLPLIASQFRVDKTRKTFVGHSYGGLLGTYIILHQPSLFESYILGSPSLWYDNKVIFEMEQRYAKYNSALPATVRYYIGGKEGKMVTDLKTFVGILDKRQYKNFDYQYKVIPNTSHFSVFALLLTEGLVELYGK
ncbi:MULTISPECIES: alpha/beta hydrolase [Pseudoalteromonas]|uniref:Alpha/beta hydrolase-fold protein n=1 Tax=Pseudoalteromonas obscura TaxID=3048491 RepID=A0ABT7ET25_9GAMM|nr:MULTISPECIES: alpha/beta hydrolase-fold protein [Pseudoalteromonas]MBQ4840122.1 alpha/beta hydrolase [Pseudoalteromonas luteoviolacea]MDK2598187.1 alpha/beta hydrolase-fold protein [Pseudoalteromonas sp. P94(2023)]